MKPTAIVTPGRIVRGRCALCRCRAKVKLYGINVCAYHETHGEDDRPCPYCHQYNLFDPRWTYTTNGSMPSKLVQRRQVDIPNTIFLDRTGECVLSVVSVPERAPREWFTKIRQTVVLIGVGMQHGTTFTITQWATDWERELFDAVIPTLALSHKVYVHGMRDIKAMAGDVRLGKRDIPWPTLNLEDKALNVRDVLDEQRIPPGKRETDLNPLHIPRLWATRDERREVVWRHNYLNVLDLSMRVFQIEWPEDRDA